MVVGDVAITGLSKSMDALSSQLKAALAFADRAQKASLALGSTYEQTRVQLGGTMEGLRGDINQRFGAAIAGMEAGLQGNTAGIARLVNQQQLTGTAFQATTKSMASLESELGLSRDDTNLLSLSLIETGSEYQISTDKLVGAIDALKSTFPAQKLAGMGNQVMTAVTQLQGELGPQLAGPLQNVMKMVMDTSMEGYERLTKLGIGDVRERLAAAQSAAEAQQILKEAFVTASDNFKSVAGNASEGFFQIGVASEIFGQQSIEFTTIADNFGKRTKKEGEQAVDFGKTLANLKAEILVPFQEAFAVAYPFLLEAMDTFSAIANTVGQRFKAFAESLGGSDGAAATMKSFKLAALDFAMVALGKMEGVFSFVKRLLTEVLPKVFTYFGDQIRKFFDIGGPFDKLRYAFLTIAEGAARAAAKLGNKEAGAFANTLMSDKLAMRTRIDMMQAAREGKGGTEDQMRQAIILRDQIGGALSDAMAKVKSGEVAAQQETMGQMLKGAADLSFGENAKRSPMYEELKKLRVSVENDEPLARKQSEDMEKLVKESKEINRKTPEIATSPEFLDETANMLSRSIEGILGIGKDTTSAEILEELKVANEQRASANSNNPAGAPINTGN